MAGPLPIMGGILALAKKPIENQTQTPQEQKAKKKKMASDYRGNICFHNYYYYCWWREGKERENK